jgi:hypothetical protein
MLTSVSELTFHLLFWDLAKNPAFGFVQLSELILVFSYRLQRNSCIETNWLDKSFSAVTNSAILSLVY